MTIIDKDSMHGTQVNGKRLERFKPMSLRSGDLVEFGARVTRGLGEFVKARNSHLVRSEANLAAKDIHECVAVTFDRVVQDTQNTYTLAGSSPVTNRRYEVPEISDDEDLSYAEDVSDASSLSDADAIGEPSSAKTTPEQAKSQLGSAFYPIDIEDVDVPAPKSRSSVINLHDDDDSPLRENVFERGSSESWRPKSPTLQSRPDPRSDRLTIAKLMQDSVDKDDNLFVPESVPALPARPQSDDAWSVLNHSVAAGGFNEAVSSPQHDEDDNIDDNSSDYDDYIEGQEQEDDVEDAELHSNSDASDMSIDAANLDANTHSAKKQASPELGSAVPPKTGASTTAGSQQPRSSWSQHSSQYYSAAPPYPISQAYYDPVRASQSMLTPYSYQPVSSYQPYAYGVPVAPQPYGSSVNPYANAPGSSRWDIPPAASSRDDCNGMYGGTSFSIADAPYSATAPYALRPGHAWDWPSSRYVPSTSESVQAFPTVTQQSPVESTSQASKNTMSIADMIEASSKADETKDVEADIVVAPTKKRKADNISRDDTAVDLEPAASTGAPDVPLSTIMELLDSREPPATRRKLEEASAAMAGRKIAGEVAKYTAAAVVGGVSTVAFLCSPLAERVLDWLA